LSEGEAIDYNLEDGIATFSITNEYNPLALEKLRVGQYYKAQLAYIGIDNVKAFHERAEDYAKEKRESFDYVTARAVARLNVLAELCLPLTKVGGYFIAMKGQGGKEELDEASNAIKVLGGSLDKIIEVDLPDNVGKREIIIIKKIKPTNNKYPREFKKIKERPL
jgi:16S rRNA (guanine527-N7)-methyltransferase